MKFKRHIVYPLLLLIYFLAMSVWFGPELIKSGNSDRLIIVGFFEGVVLILLYFFLKKRDSFRH